MKVNYGIKKATSNKSNGSDRLVKQKAIKKYRKGADFERLVVRDEKAKGRMALRSAGSKSSVDCVSIDTNTRTIRLIQCKVGSKRYLREQRSLYRTGSEDGYKVIWEIREHESQR